MAKSTYKRSRKHKKYHGGDENVESSTMTTTESNVQQPEVIVPEEQPTTSVSLTDKLKGHFSRARSYLASLTGGRKTRSKHARKHTKSHKRRRTHKRKH